MRYVWLIGFLILNSGLLAQSKTITFRGSDNDESLIGVSIIIGNEGFITDNQGGITLDISKFPADLKVNYIGYKTLNLHYDNMESVPDIIFLDVNSTILDDVVVTSSKYEQNVTRSPVSVDIIKPSLVESINSTSAEDVLNKIPGVQILDGQANIRGGSGYSYGAGSRVMLLIDDIPALQPDAGFPNWNDIPIENLSQIEVLKGAASTLYGSAALNGIINYRSSYAKSSPETHIAIGGKTFLSPKDESRKWWGDTTRYETNFSIVHKQKFKKIDLIASGFLNKMESYNQNNFINRGRAYVNLRYRFKENLIFQLGTLGNIAHTNSFFLWLNGNEGAYQAFPGTLSERHTKRLYIDPSVTWFDNKSNKHKLMARTMIVDNKNDSGHNNSSVNNYVEYQFQRDFKDIGLMLTTGVVGQWSKSVSQLLGDTTFYSENHAVYFQADKKIGSKLTISGGLRYEYVRQKSPEVYGNDTIPGGIVTDDKLIARVAANYQLAEYSSIRASYGQGYRYPTLTERFVETKFGFFSILSNPHLVRETGWSREIGIKQGFALGGFKGFIDLSAFVSEYKDMIEFTFLGPKDLGYPGFGFKPLNIGDTHISGYEIGITGQLDVGSVPITVFGGYTYINPTYKNFAESELIQSTISEYADSINVLKYRSKHQIKMDVEAKFGKFKWGVSFQYASHFLNIDRAFEDPLPGILENPDSLFGIRAFRQSHDKGYKLIDTRVSYEIGRWKFSLLANNLLNEEYTLRPALLEAPRSVGMRVDYSIK